MGESESERHGRKSAGVGKERREFEEPCQTLATLCGRRTVTVREKHGSSVTKISYLSCKQAKKPCNCTLEVRLGVPPQKDKEAKASARCRGKVDSVG